MPNLVFPFTDPPFGSAKGEVLVMSDHLEIKHKVLKHNVVVPLAEVAGAVADPAEEVDQAMFTRDVGVLPLKAASVLDPNLVIVLRQPLQVSGFKMGADRALGIPSKARKRGMAVDAIVLAVDDPAGLRVALTPNAEESPRGLVDLLGETVGRATGPEVDRRRASIKQKRRRAQALMAFWGVAIAALNALRLLPDDTPLDVFVRIGGAAALFAVGIGAFVSLIPRRPPRPRVRSARARAVSTMLFSLLAIAGVVALVVALRTTMEGRALYASLAALGGVFGGVVAGLAFRSPAVSSPAPESVPSWPAAPPPAAPAPSPSIWSTPAPPVEGRSLPSWGWASSAPPTDALPPPPVAVPGTSSVSGGPGRAARVAVGLGAMALGLLTVSTTPGVSADGRLAKEAVVEETDLPLGWTQCCPPHQFFVSELDQHICASDPDLPAHTAGYERYFAYRRANDVDYGRMTVAVIMAPTEANAKAEIAAVHAPGYLDCVRQSAGRGAAEAVGRRRDDAVPATLVGQWSPGSVQPGTTVNVDSLTSTFAPNGTHATTVQTAFVRMQIGRAIVRMPILSYGSPLSSATVTPIVLAVEQQVRDALAAAGEPLTVSSPPSTAFVLPR